MDEKKVVKKKSSEEEISEELRKAFAEEPLVDNAEADQDFFEKGKKSGLKLKKGGASGEKKWLILLIFGVLGLVGGASCLIIAMLLPVKEGLSLSYPEIPSRSAGGGEYSNLTGEVLANPELKNAPTFCVQTPNGTDGARPQSGLNQAGVIFEAIAEAGITRFAAIYQNPTAAVIGPIRSLRMYYLEWDTPFDCTIVHAGGADDALVAVSRGGYRDLTENYAYMYRGTYSGRLWNNLFTTADYLKQFNSDMGFQSSDVKGFTRMTPDEANKKKVDELVNEPLNILVPTTNNTSELSAEVSSINLRFGGLANFNVSYNYDLATNKYLRSYENGVAHEVYSCPDENLGEQNPEDVCNLVQMAPSVVIAMVVNERRAADGYHEDITTIGTGEVYVFQNGGVESGTWNKDSRDEQIRFLNENGEEIKLIPGQTFVTAIPSYGSVDF